MSKIAIKSMALMFDNRKSNLDNWPLLENWRNVEPSRFLPFSTFLYKNLVGFQGKSVCSWLNNNI